MFTTTSRETPAVRVAPPLLVAFLLTAPSFAQKADREPDPTKLAAAVRKVLPPGWGVTRTQQGSSPDDWETSSPKAGFLVEGGNGKDTFRIWFLPRDWVGIRKVPNKAPRTCYWEGILVGDHYKTITAASDETFCDRMHHLFLGSSQSTPSLCNGGYHEALKIFRGKADAADRESRALIKKHCKTPEQFAEAAHSLVVLGVPAKSVFLRAAREVEGMDKDLFCSVLGYMGGEDAIGVLCDLVADARLEGQRRGYAASALAGHTDKRIGPALHTAVKQLRDEDALGRVVRVLACVRYAPAGPDLLAAFKRMKNGHYQAEVAQALAALRYRQAVPEIRGFVEGFRSRGQEPPCEAEIALLRLTADWGKPGRQYRLHVVAPAEAVVGRPMRLTIYVENVGDEPLWRWNSAEYGLVIDGKAPKREMKDGFGGIMSQFDPGEVHTITCDVSDRITAPGKHTVLYAPGEARSNVVTITVRPAKR